MISDFEKKLLLMKKQLFLDSVREVSEILKIDVPKVRFLDLPCSGFDESELAHIHVEEKMICVSIRNLHRMNLDDIEEVAAHEVSHLIQADHSPAFREELINAKLGTWLQRRTNHKINKTKTKKLKNDTKIDKVRCNYHLCRKMTVLKQCKYCKGYFCKIHIEPKPPGTRNFDYSSNKRRLFDEKSNSPEGHPDAVYYDHLMKVEEDGKQRYRESLKAVLNVNKNSIYSNNKSEQPISSEEASVCTADYDIHNPASQITHKTNGIICNKLKCDSRITTKCEYCQNYYCPEHIDRNYHNCKSKYHVHFIDRVKRRLGFHDSK